MNESATAAVLWALASIAVGVVTELTGNQKYSPYPGPKSISEIMKEWPRFIEESLIVFVVTFLWQYCKTEKVDNICPKCGDVVSSGVDETLRCQKCYVPLEILDGFFERHPEKR